MNALSACGGAVLRRLLIFLIPLSIAGCVSTMQIQAGAKPDVSALARSLEVGKSTQQAVQIAIGIPDGRGRTMLPWQKSPRTVWSYYYEEGVIDIGGGPSDARRIFLFVFFDGDKFDGYMWFSSLASTQ